MSNRLFTTKLRGHKIYTTNGKDWFYDDTNEPTVGGDRDCNYCGLPRTKEGHDPCIAGLKGGVKNACCGHGNNKEAYVQFQDDYCVRGRDAIVLQQILKEYGEEQ